MIQDILSWYSEFSLQNPMVASAFGLGLGGWALMMLRNTPMAIYRFIKSRLVTTLVMNNSNNNGHTTVLFMRWFNERSGWGHLSRNLALEVLNNDNEQIDYVSGFGLNFFFWKGRLFWFSKKALDSAGTYLEKFEVTLSMLGRDTRVIKDLVEQFRYRRGVDKLTVHTYQHGWGNSIDVRRRSKESVILSERTSAAIFDKIDDFVKERQWYYDRGLPYKLCFMFSGIPGSGKTSLSKVIGSEYNRDIYSISLVNMTDEKLRQAVLAVPPGNVIQFDDFDRSNSVKSRTLKALTADEHNHLTSTLKSDGVQSVSLDDLTWETIQSIKNENGDPSRLTIMHYEDTPFTYYYWDRYIDTPVIGTITVELSTNFNVATCNARYEMMGELAPLHNRLAAGSGDETTKGGLTLGGVLNALDGIIPLDDQIIILNTNCPEGMDSALVRKGRIDHAITINEMGDPEVRKYIKLMFPDASIPMDRVFKPIAGCDIQAIFYEHKYDANAFIDAIPRVS